MNRFSHPPHHDVLICGAGPAGAHLAIRLARRGWSVALLDRKRFPRPKPCGEFMSPACLPLLAELDLEAAVRARGARRVEGMVLHGYDRRVKGRFRPVGSARAPQPYGLAVQREVLDDLALQAARATPGVEVLEGHEVLDLLREPGGRVLGARVRGPHLEVRELRARCTVGADGVRSRIARSLGVHRGEPWLQKFALVARFPGVPAASSAEVHFLPDGYLAACPVQDDVYTVNLVVDRGALPAGCRAALPEFLAAHIEAAPPLAARLGGSRPEGRILACGPLAGRTTAQVFDGAALVGDACGYVDPVTGEGLYYAMRGAALLAAALDPALAAGRVDRRSLRPYARARRREFGPAMALARLLQRGMRHPTVVRAFLGALQARSGLADLLVAMTGNYVPYRQLLQPRIWWRALRHGAGGPAAMPGF